MSRGEGQGGADRGSHRGSRPERTDRGFRGDSRAGGGSPRRSSADGGRSESSAGRGPRGGERSDRAPRGEGTFDRSARGGKRPGGPARGQDRGGHSERGGSRPAGTFDNSERRGGSRLAPKAPRLPEPRIPEEVTGKELDRSVHHQLRTLSKENAEGVAQHLVMVAVLLEADELEAALAHAETAVRRAGRVPAAREALGMVAYRQGDFARALGEFRTVRRLSGSNHLLPLMVDCERGLGRHARALELAGSPEARSLDDGDKAELAIVVSGVRRDLHQDEAALLALQIPQLKRGSKPGVHRLQYAYADALLALCRVGEAREWFAKAAAGDSAGETDAVERLEEIDGISLEDLAPGEEDETS